MKAWHTLSLFPLLLATAAAPAQTGEAAVDQAEAGDRAIYRTVDENGNVVFTDNPADKDRAEPVTVGPTNTMDSRRALPEVSETEPRAQEREDDDAAAAGYSELKIVTPADGATVRMPQDNPVAVRAVPDPSLRAGHRLVILDNGTPVEGGALDLPNPGPHQLQAAIEDDSGRRLITSEPVTLYVHRINASDAGAPGDGAGGSGNAFPTRGGASQRGEASGRATTASPGGAAQRGTGAGLGGGAQRVTRPANQ